MRELGRLIVPTKSSAPATPTAGEVYYNSTDGNYYVWDGIASAWVDLTVQGGSGTKVIRTVHTWAIKGTVVATDTIPAFFYSKATGQSTTIVKCRARIATGTSATFKVQKNGADLTGYGTTGAPLSASTTATDVSTTTTAALADNDELELVLVAATGTPVDLTVTLVMEHTV